MKVEETSTLGSEEAAHLCWGGRDRFRNDLSVHRKKAGRIEAVVEDSRKGCIRSIHCRKGEKSESLVVVEEITLEDKPNKRGRTGKKGNAVICIVSSLVRKGGGNKNTSQIAEKKGGGASPFLQREEGNQKSGGR